MTYANKNTKSAPKDAYFGCCTTQGRLLGATALVVCFAIVAQQAIFDCHHSPFDEFSMIRDFEKSRNRKSRNRGLILRSPFVHRSFSEGEN